MPHTIYALKYKRIKKDDGCWHVYDVDEDRSKLQNIINKDYYLNTRPTLIEEVTIREVINALRFRIEYDEMISTDEKLDRWLDKERKKDILWLDIKEGYIQFSSKFLEVSTWR